MSARETTATPPAPTRYLAQVLPAPLRFLACGGIHTIRAGYLGGCAVCDRDWTGRGRRRWLHTYGYRSPIRRQRASETVIHVRLIPGLELHRVPLWSGRYYWQCSWRWEGDTHHARLRPTVDFHHHNVSREARRERADQEAYANMRLREEDE